MKNKIYLWALIAIVFFSFLSCNDFLNEDPKTSITEDQIYSSPEYAESNLQTCYLGWRTMFTDRYLWEVMVGTDEIQSGAYQALKEDGMKRGSLDRYDALLTSELSYVADQWGKRWTKVGECAKLIRSLRPDANNDKKASQVYGEACFIRAGLTMELTMIYGRIPILDLNRIEILGYGRQNLSDVWQFIINDFKEAEKYCPETNEPGRATIYAASMLLGYAYMAAPEETGLRDFEKAKDALYKVVTGPFSLVDYYDLFDYSTPNTIESIFEWQFSNTYPDNNMLQFQLGSRAVQSMGGDACYMSGYDHAVPTKWAYSDVENGGIWESGDVRKEETIRYDFTWFGKAPTLESVAWEDLGDDHDELLPHIKKYEDFRTDSHSNMGINNMWHSGKNIPFLRLGNAILLYAECLNELGLTSEAIEEVNKVRKRAWNNELPVDKAWKIMSQNEFRERISTERVRELLGERWRKFDLVRTGRFLEYIQERNKWAKRSGTIQEYNKIWPIPLSEIDQNDDISPEDQNDGYR